MERQVFKDDLLDAKFRDKGFVTVPYLSDAEINKLKEVCMQNMPAGLTTLYSNVYAGLNYEYNVKVTELLKEVFTPLIAEHLIDFSAISGSFLVKGVGNGGVSNIHQDWNVVDENRHVSLSLWCPLTDVDETNGALYVISGSHRLFNSVRSTTLLSTRMEFDHELEQFLRILPMKAGEVCIYAHSLFHGSKPNYSNEVRIAVTCTAIPKDAKFIHYYHAPGNSDNESEALEIGEDFYHRDLLEAIKGAKPQHKNSLGISKHEQMPLQPSYILQKLREAKMEGTI